MKRLLSKHPPVSDGRAPVDLLKETECNQVISGDVSWSVTERVPCFHRLIWSSESRTRVSIIWASVLRPWTERRSERRADEMSLRDLRPLKWREKLMAFPHACNQPSKQGKTVFQGWKKRITHKTNFTPRWLGLTVEIQNDLAARRPSLEGATTPLNLAPRGRTSTKWSLRWMLWWWRAGSNNDLNRHYWVTWMNTVGHALWFLESASYFSVSSGQRGGDDGKAFSH